MDLNNRINRLSLVDREKNYNWPKVIGITTGGIAITYILCSPLSSIFEKKYYINNNDKQSFKYLKKSYIPVTLGTLIVIFGLYSVDKNEQSENNGLVN
jgi:hypothetical protein